MSNPKNGSLFQASDLHFSYTLGDQKIDALRGLTLDISEGSFNCLFGPSGSGKTTLLNILGLIIKPQQGSIHFLGRNLKSLSEADKNNIRLYKLGFIFQTHNLFQVLRADENVEYFLVRQGRSAKERRIRVQWALEAVGLWDHRMKRPLEMSGGQRQRVAIARAIAKNPEVIVADEPTASLDQHSGKEVMETLSRLNKQNKVTIILSSHDAMVKAYATNSIHVRDGHLVDDKIQLVSTLKGA